MRAWRNIDNFEGRSSLRSWLYRIATNVCLDMLQGPQRRARPMDLGPSSPADTAPACRAAREHVDPAGSRRSGASRGRRPGRAGRVTRDDPSRLRGRAPAPAAEAAGRADPARGPSVAGERGGRAARHERRVGEQRAPSAPAPRSNPSNLDCDEAAAVRRGARGAARALRRRVRALRHHVARGAAARGRFVHHAAVRIVARRARSRSATGTSVRAAAAAVLGWWRRPPTVVPHSRATSRPPAVAGNRSTSTSSRFQTVGSRGCTTSSTPSASPTTGFPLRLEQ